MTTHTLPDNTLYQLAEWEKSNNEEYLRQLLEPLAIRPGSVVLDLGCGSGYVTAYVSRRYEPRRNLALDYDGQALQLAREMTRPYTTGPIHWACAKAEQVPLADDCVDHLVCRGVMQLTDVPKTVAEIGRLTKQGGTVMLLLHTWRFYVSQLSLNPRRWRKSAVALSIIGSSLLFHLSGKLFRPRLGPWRVTESFQTVSRMKKLLSRYGLEILRIDREPEFILYARKTMPASPA